MSVVFIAIPTKGTVVNGRITEEVKRDIARLHDMFPEHTFVCPMIQDYELLAHLQSSEATYEVWGKRCEQLIAKCDEMIVLMYDGWAGPWLARDGNDCTSVGVEGEIEFAFNNQVPIVFVSTRELSPVRSVMSVDRSTTRKVYSNCGEMKLVTPGACHE